MKRFKFGKTDTVKKHEIEMTGKEFNDTSHIIASSLKNWLKKHPDSDTKIIVHGSKIYSLIDVINEIDKGSEIGNELISAWIELIIKMTLREKNE